MNIYDTTWDFMQATVELDLCRKQMRHCDQNPILCQSTYWGELVHREMRLVYNIKCLRDRLSQFQPKLDS